MKPIVTAVLILCIFSIRPVKAWIPVNADDPGTGKKSTTVVCAVVALGVGAVVIWGLWKMCSKIPVPPPVDPPPPPPTNPPPIFNPTNAPPTNPPPKKPWWKLGLLDNSASFDISSYGLQDSFNPNVNYHTMVTFTIQSSTNLAVWSEEVSATGWVSDNGIFFAYYRAGSNALNTYTTPGHTNYAPIPIVGDEPRKFFRMMP